EVELTRSTMQSLLENGENIQRMAHRILIIFSGLHTASLSTEQLKQATDMIDKELFPMLPRETVQMIQQSKIGRASCRGIVKRDWRSDVCSSDLRSRIDSFHDAVAFGKWGKYSAYGSSNSDNFFWASYSFIVHRATEAGYRYDR